MPAVILSRGKTVEAIIDIDENLCHQLMQIKPVSHSNMSFKVSRFESSIKESKVFLFFFKVKTESL